MNKNRFAFESIILTFLPGLIFIGFGFSQQDSHRTISRILIGLGYFCIGSASAQILHLLKRKGKERLAPSVVRMWSRNGIVVIAAKEECDIWYKQHERAILADIERTEDRPVPKYAGYFTDDPKMREDLDGFYTGNLADCEKIIKGCRVERMELFIPNQGRRTRREILESYGAIFIEPDDLYRLIHRKSPVPHIFSTT